MFKFTADSHRAGSVRSNLGSVARLSGLTALMLMTLTLAGCGKGNFGEIPSQPTPTPPTPAPPTPPTPPAPTPPYSGPTFTARVLAGTAPISGASVQLYSAGAFGNGSFATALLSAAVVTDSSGNAVIPANYTCTSGSAMTYLLAKGATAGNANVSLFAALGPCSGVTAGSSFVINEVTTVAGAYALAPFLNSSSIGASSTNLQGLTNAFLTAGTLANVTTGSSAGTTLPANGSSPAALVNSIANVLNACVTNSANCTALTSLSSTRPANTLDAIAGLTHAPATNVADIYKQSLLSSVYAPAVTAQPTDWTLYINYGGSGLDSLARTSANPAGTASPSGIAVDSTGAVWVSTYFGIAAKFSNIGVPQFPSGVSGYGLNNSFGLAIDQSDNVWIPNQQPYSGSNPDGTSIIGSITQLSPAGASLSGGGGYTAGGMSYPSATSIDPNGNVWIVQYGDAHVTVLNKSGVPLTGPYGFTKPTFGFPIAVATDNNHIGWVADQEDNFITRVSADGSNSLGINCCNGPASLAVDLNGRIWAANFFGNSLSVLNPDGSILTNGGYLGNGALFRPQGIAIDGGGNAFVANYRASYIVEVAANGTSISPAAGYGADSGVLEAYALAIDASGNVWVSGLGNTTVTKFIGLAVPVKTPISGAARVP